MTRREKAIVILLYVILFVLIAGIIFDVGSFLLQVLRANAQELTPTSQPESVYLFMPYTSGGIPFTPTPIPTPTSPPEPEIYNGDFELGRNVGWSEYSSIPGKEIVNNFLPATPHSGTWGAWFGGIVSAPTKYDIIEGINPVTVTQSSHIGLWFFVNSQENCPQYPTTCWDCMKFLVKHPSEPPSAWRQLWKQDACYGQNSSAWEHAQFAIPAGEWTYRIWFQYGSDIYVSSILIDDVELDQ